MFTSKEKREIIDGRLAEICSAKGISIDDIAGRLDEIFSEAFSNADTLFDRVDLIDKFESAYPELLRVSNWYRCNLEQFSDQRREYDELTLILDKLKRSSPNHNFDWTKLAAQFRAVLGGIAPYSAPGPESDDELWRVKRSQEVKQPYETLAKRGLKALGFPGGSKGLEGWYSLLRLHSSLSKYKFDQNSYGVKQFALTDRGKIEPLCIASADYCESLATGANADRRHDVPITNINNSLERRHKAPHLRGSKAPSVAREKQLDLFPSSSACGKVRRTALLMGVPERSATGDLYPVQSGADLTARSNSELKPSKHRNGRIKEDSLAKIVSIQERLEAMVTQLTQQHQATKPKRVSKSYLSDFEGLPEKPVSHPLASAPLTDKQLMCARLKWDYMLTNAEIAGRLRKARPTVIEHLEAARKKIENVRSSARRAKGIKTPPERN